VLVYFLVKEEAMRQEVEELDRHGQSCTSLEMVQVHEI
jgi:hypothetical protein